MAEKLILELVSPERLLKRQEVEEVVAPGTEGEFGILPGHRPFLTTLMCGEIRYTSEGKAESVAISGGFAEISDDEVKIMADTAEFKSEIDIERAQKAKSVSEEKLKELDSIDEADDFARFQAKLKRAVCRIKIASLD